jgi:hypothetical protein
VHKYVVIIMQYLISLITNIVLSFPAYANKTVFKTIVVGLSTFPNTKLRHK